MVSIKITNLSKYFKNQIVLNKVNLLIEKGCLLGLAGPNGSGKTTFLKILAGLLIQDEGTVEIFGHNILNKQERVKRLTGFIPSEERSFYFRLTGRQNLEFFGSLYSVPSKELARRIDYFLSLFKLTGFADIKYSNYSSGIKQKFQIVRALLHNPSLLLIDELTKSLDSDTAPEIFNFTKSIVKQESKIAIVVSHNVDELKNICDLVVQLQNGEICN